MVGFWHPTVWLLLVRFRTLEDLGLEDIGVEQTPSGHIKVDGVSRTSVNSIYAAGDRTGVYPLASVAAMQGRTAMVHIPVMRCARCVPIRLPRTSSPPRRL